MPTIQANSKTILSIYPLNMEYTARHNGFITYKHPAAKRDVILAREYSPARMSTSEPGRVPADEPMFRDTERPCEKNQGYTLISVYDTFTWQRDFTQDDGRSFAAPLLSPAVANELVRVWASDVIEGDAHMGPGMIVIAGDTPTADELAAVTQRQTAYARALINAAHVHYSKGDVKEISSLHRAMATWMGTKNVPWIAELEQVDMKHCRACDEQIRAKAIRCSKCNVDLVEFYQKHGIVPTLEEDPGVFAFIEAQKAKKITPTLPGNKAAA